MRGIKTYNDFLSFVQWFNNGDTKEKNDYLEIIINSFEVENLDADIMLEHMNTLKFLFRK